MSEMRNKVMTIRWWALRHACDIAGNDRPSKDDIVMMYKLVDILKDTHEIEHLAMENAELAEHAAARMCEMHPGFGMPAAAEHHDAAAKA